MIQVRQMNKYRRMLQTSIPTAMTWGILFLLPVNVLAATYYVDSVNGSDANSGLSTSAALQSTAAANSLSLNPGDSVLFRRGQNFGGLMDIGSNGTSSNPIIIGAWDPGNDPVLYEVKVSGDYVIIENLVLDHEKAASDTLTIRSGRNCILRNLELRNGTRDGIDADQADGLLIENVEIHHFLNGSFGSEDDSHGIVVTSTDGITIRDANIHHVSGDSFQSDPNRSPGNITDNIVIEDSVLWTGPLQEDFNAGWVAGNSPGENAIDTKVLKSGYDNEIRMKITLRNVTAYGWTAVPEISNRAVFNLKEKITATMDRITVSDSEIAFRIRGALGNADTTITNTVIFDVDKAIRSEDNLANLIVFNTTFGDGIANPLQHAGGSGGAATWDWRNNAFVGPKPSEASDPTNVIASASDFISSSQRDYRLSPGSSLIDAGVFLSEIIVDRNSNPRSAPYDSGAFDLSSSGSRPKPPILSVSP